MDQIMRQMGGRGWTFGPCNFIHLGGPNQDAVTTGSFSESRDPVMACMWLRRLV